jgi:hypothetical protein
LEVCNEPSQGSTLWQAKKQLRTITTTTTKTKAAEKKGAYKKTAPGSPGAVFSSIQTAGVKPAKNQNLC